MVPVPKKNNIGIFEVDNFCGITLAPVMYKVMCSVVQERLVEIVEGKQLLAEEQGGFWRGGDTETRF